jgi:hypothetical protein
MTTTQTSVPCRRLVLFAAAAAVAAAGSDGAAAPPRLVVYYETGLLPWSETNPAAQVMKQAASCGYTEMVVADGSLQGVKPIKGELAANLSEWQAFAEKLGLGITPLIYPFSVPEYTIYASSPLGGELAEPLFSKGAPFQVSTDGRRLLHRPTSFLTNGDLSRHDSAANTFEGWMQTLPGNRTFVDTKTVGPSGKPSLRIGAGFGSAMMMQNLSTIPLRRQLRISYWAKSEQLSTVQYNVEVCKLDPTQALGLGRRISWTSMVINATQEWTQFEFVSSSWDGGLGLFVGLQPDGALTPMQQPMNGTLWFADIVVEDTALVNTVRRAGAPLRVYTPDGTRTFVEGRDFDPIAPPANFTGFSKGFRNTANVTLPATGSTLQPGDHVLIDYYAVDLVFGGDTCASAAHLVTPAAWTGLPLHLIATLACLLCLRRRLHDAPRHVRLHAEVDGGDAHTVPKVPWHVHPLR